MLTHAVHWVERRMTYITFAEPSHCRSSTVAWHNPIIWYHRQSARGGRHIEWQAAGGKGGYRDSGKARRPGGQGIGANPADVEEDSARAQLVTML